MLRIFSVLGIRKRPTKAPKSQSQSPRLPNNMIHKIASMAAPPNRWRMAHTSKAFRNRILTPNLARNAVAHTFWERLQTILDALEKRDASVPSGRVLGKTTLPDGRSLGAIVYRDNSVEVRMYPRKTDSTALFRIHFSGTWPRTVQEYNFGNRNAIAAYLRTKLKAWAKTHTFYYV